MRKDILEKLKEQDLLEKNIGHIFIEKENQKRKMEISRFKIKLNQYKVKRNYSGVNFCMKSIERLEKEIKESFLKEEIFY